VVGDIVELRVDTSTYALLTWLADNVSRCHFDDVDAWIGGADGSDIGDLAKRRQREAIFTMAHVILQSSHEGALEYVKIDDLLSRAIDVV
jgi:hypothetical protein